MTLPSYTNMVRCGASIEQETRFEGSFIAFLCTFDGFEAPMFCVVVYLFHPVFTDASITSETQFSSVSRGTRSTASSASYNLPPPCAPHSPIYASAKPSSVLTMPSLAGRAWSWRSVLKPRSWIEAERAGSVSPVRAVAWADTGELMQCAPVSI
jgi:hypothetical protein